MKRREFLTLFGGTVATWPMCARAQGIERKRRVGVLMSTSESDPREVAAVAVLVTALGARGWVEGKNLELIYRWGAGDSDRMMANARQVIALEPDLLVVKGANLPAAREVAGSIPIVFVLLSDIAAQEYVTSFARPGGTITGFASSELTLVGKRLALLRELSPRTQRVLYVTGRLVGVGTRDLLARISRDAAAAGITLIDGSAESGTEIEAAARIFARESDGGIIVAFNAFTTVHRETIVAAANRLRLPAIYPLRSFTDGGGLFSYGFDQNDQFQQAAAYVDRILKGEKPGDLPVQEPTKFEMILNLKTAKALGLAIPPTLLARADEVIE
jgi:putative tryptophan/tyrosine transport system substrate-binding protein